jgi:hypothetical protein
MLLGALMMTSRQTLGKRGVGKLQNSNVAWTLR